MSTIKITQLPELLSIDANTSNTLILGVDVPTGATGKITAHTLAQGLYSNEILNVGTNQQNLPNTVAQFTLNANSYIQTNLVNTNDGGSADIVVTANSGSGGTDSTNFIDMGYANKYYQPGLEFNNIGNAIYPLDGYLYVQGTASSNGQGFIAHELAEVCPDAVTGEKDAVNEDGTIKSQGIDTSFLVATLTAAIQEQQAMIETLTTRLNALEGK